MILSRFWYVILALAATFALLVALLVASVVDTIKRDAVIDDLRRDRFEVEALLKLDARSRIDAIAPIAANAEVRSALRTASVRTAGQPIPPDVTTRLRAKLEELNGRLEGMRGDLLFAVDRNGWIVAAIAPGQIPTGAGLGDFPLVARAREGYVRDDVWVYNDDIYRMAARPVIEGGEYVGALVHGKRFDDQLAQLLSSRLNGATVAFFYGNTMKAGHMPADVTGAPQRDELGAERLSAVMTDERFRAGERTDPQALPRGGLAVYSLVTGTARDANVGYAIGRPVETTPPWAVVRDADVDAWTAILKEPKNAGVLGGFFVLAILIALFATWLEHGRPLKKMLRAASALPGNPENRITVTDHGGKYRKIAQAVNDAISNAARAGGPPQSKKVANLDEILGPEPSGGAQGPSFFGFQQPQGPGGDFQIPDVPPPSPGMPATMMLPAGGGPPPGGYGMPPAGPPAARPPGPPVPPGPPPKPPVPGMSPPGPPPGMPAPPRPPLPPGSAPGPGMKAAPPPPALPPRPDTPSGYPPAPSGPPLSVPPEDLEPYAEGSSESSQATAIAKPGARKQLKRTLLGVPPPQEDEEDEGATMVAKVPDELIAQSASSPAGGSGDDEDRHFREVYERFVDTKKQCGEPVAGLTYDKFLVTLRKNRDQIVSRHGARKVRFTVYVKNGKAALKATPIRE
jgi:hypothetical protein